MATIANEVLRRDGMTPSASDRWLGIATIAFTALIAIALLRGRSHWQAVPGTIWLHLALLLPALVLTPILMAGRKGNRRHRRLGYVWAVLLIATAIEAFFIPVAPRTASPIWLLCIFVLIQVPRLVLAARGHDVTAHRRRARAMTIGALLVAGLFTLPFGRLLGTWLFSG